jgi:group II intron reverse transcriptase/maturase
MLLQLQQIAAQAAADRNRVFTNLAHRIDKDLLRRAYELTRKDGAVGVDGQDGKTYGGNLEANLEDLHRRLKECRYQAASIKRVWIPKDGQGQRPLGITTFEDKVVQRAVVMLFEAVYEQDFYNVSYGFRPGLSAHTELGQIRHQIMDHRLGWIVEADIRGCFDNLDHDVLRELLHRRVHDGGIDRLIGKWLNAGIQDGGELFHLEKGAPQGGVISPMLANIYLHYVLDEWWVEIVQPRLKGRACLVRYCDDFVIGCEREEDARRVLEALPKRLGKYGLAIHPEKTRLVPFQAPRAGTPRGEHNDTFDFLGFTHYWGKSRRGYWVVKRRTMRRRLRRAMKMMADWCRWNRHRPLKEQYEVLCQKLRGHYQYYGLRGNYRPMELLYEHTLRVWHKWLSRRSRASYIPWERFARFLKVLPLPTPKIIHAV